MSPIEILSHRVKHTSLPGLPSWCAIVGQVLAAGSHFDGESFWRALLNFLQPLWWSIISIKGSCHVVSNFPWESLAFADCILLYKKFFQSGRLFNLYVSSISARLRLPQLNRFAGHPRWFQRIYTQNVWTSLQFAFWFWQWVCWRDDTKMSCISFSSNPSSISFDSSIDNLSLVWKEISNSPERILCPK